MVQNRIRQLWSENRPVLNGWISTGSPYIAEVMAAQGYDSLTIDAQHGLMGRSETIAMLQAMRASGVAPIIRVPWLDPAAIMHALDTGALGIICPMIDDRAQTELFVSCMRYPPEGGRSFGPARAIIAHGDDYVARANAEVVAFAMIETRKAMENLDEIVTTPGLDAVYVGPSDLTLNLSNGKLKPGMDRTEPEMIEAIRHIAATAKSAGLRSGIFCASPEYAAQAIEWGFDLVNIANDVRLLTIAAADSLAQTRALIGSGG